VPQENLSWYSVLKISRKVTHAIKCWFSNNYFCQYLLLLNQDCWELLQKVAGVWFFWDTVYVHALHFNIVLHCVVCRLTLSSTPFRSAKLQTVQWLGQNTHDDRRAQAPTSTTQRWCWDLGLWLTPSADQRHSAHEKRRSYRSRNVDSELVEVQRPAQHNNRSF